jgi:hypothetical protein
MIYAHVFTPMAVLARTGLFFLPDFVIGNIMHHTVFNTPSRDQIYHCYGYNVAMNCYVFPMCLRQDFETCFVTALVGYATVCLFHHTKLLLYSLAYTAHLRHFNAFPRPLVRVIAYHAFQRLSKLFSCLY